MFLQSDFQVGLPRGARPFREVEAWYGQLRNWLSVGREPEQRLSINKTSSQGESWTRLPKEEHVPRCHISATSNNPDGPGIVPLTQPASQKHPYIHEAMARRILCLDLIGEPRAYISTCPTRSRKTNSANCSVPLHAGGACQGIPSTPLAPGGTGRTTISLGSGSRRYLQIRSAAQDGMPRTPSRYYWLRRVSSREANVDSYRSEGGRGSCCEHKDPGDWNAPMGWCGDPLFM